MSGADASLVAALADRYRIERELGRGGMATVYLAHDLKHRRPVALKVLTPDAASSVGEERFLREIELAAGLLHPNIVPVFDSGADAGHLWFTMPYVQGETLRSRLEREGQLPLREALRIATETARALDAAHGRGILHRDVKPENLLLTSDGSTLVADFGIARGTADPTGLTQTGVVVGTPAYMSPEQAAGERALDARSDVYAIGCVLYEMLAGAQPFTGHTVQALLARRLSEPVPPLAPVRDVPAAVERSVLRALARSPADRFATAGELARALEEAGTGEAPATRPPDGRSRRRATLGALALFIAIVAVTFAVRAVRSPGAGDGPGADGPASIGVLPFADLSEAGDQAYFSDGLTEEIITALSRVEGVRVAARSSSFQLRGADVDVREVARRLNVRVVLEGSVRRSGTALRVTAQLVNAEDGYQLWADSYQRELADVFEVQEDIARSIISALRVTLGAGPDEALRGRPTEDLEAYDLYLKGRFAWNRRDADGLREAVRYLEEAVVRDPGFAAAWGALADAYVLAIPYAGLPRDETWPRARAAAERALTMDPRLGQAHAALAYGTMVYEWDWDTAESEFRTAIEVAPGYATGHQWYGDFLWSRGRLDEALARMLEALRLDPLSLIIGLEVGNTYYLMRRFDEAEASHRETLRLEPDYPYGLYLLGLVLLQQDRLAEAVAALERARDLGGYREDVVATLAHARARGGQTDEARRLLADLERRYADGTAGPFAVAIAYTGLGDLDAGFAWLERAIDERDEFLPEDYFDPLLDPLRADPRFAAIDARMGIEP